MKSVEIIKSSLLTLLALLLSSGFCLAQITCPLDVEAEDPEPREWLHEDYQPRKYDPGDESVLRRRRYNPANYDDTKSYPTVISIPPAVFRSEDCDGVPSQRVATTDLIEAGYLVFQVEHRLAPDGLIWKQTPHDTTTQRGIASGRPPQQTNDIKQQILAALADEHCNGEIFLLGGSSGASHALWVALDSNTSIVPGWNETVRGQIKAVVGLSGMYDLSLRFPPPSNHFIDAVQNYTNTVDNFVGLEFQYSVSPIARVAAATNIPPIRMYASENESVRWEQAQNMYNALHERDQSLDVFYYVLPDSPLHAFNYWHEMNTLVNPPICVSAQVIAFFDTYK